jgi:hypothetical protein
MLLISEQAEPGSLGYFRERFKLGVKLALQTWHLPVPERHFTFLQICFDGLSGAKNSRWYSLNGSFAVASKLVTSAGIVIA